MTGMCIRKRSLRTEGNPFFQSIPEMKKWITSVISSAYFLSLSMTIIMIILIPPAFNRYKIEPSADGIRNYKNPDSYLFFVDLKKDGSSYKIDSYHDGEMRPCIQVYDDQGAITDQWNLRGDFTSGRNHALAFGDIDNDLDLEIFVFTIAEDSVFLSCIDKLDGGFLFREKFVTTISKAYSKKLNYSVRPEGFFDLDGDGYKEFLFGVAGARSLQPRQMFAYCFRKNMFTATESYGNMISSVSVMDIDRDGVPEITGNTSAAGNIHDSLGIPYDDYHAWLMVLDNQLRTKFEPTGFDGFRNHLMVLPFDTPGGVMLAALLNPLGTALAKPVLFLFSPDGQVIKERKMPHLAKENRHFCDDPFSEPGKYFLVIDGNGMEQIGHDLATHHRVEFPFYTHHRPLLADLDNDGRQEMVLREESGNRLLVYRSLKSAPASYDVPPLLEDFDISYGVVGNNSPVLVLQSAEKYLLLQYAANPLYYLQWLIYAGIYAGLLLFILFIRALQRMQLEKRQAVKSQILQLQLKTIHNQMDPHFTFNVFNSIAHIIRNEDRDYAFQSFLKFSGIIRSTLLDSDKITRPLEDEVRFVENYLALEKLRYKDHFSHEIRISPDVNQATPVPKMILQIFVENAVKHGLRHNPEKGKLSIDIREENKKLVMTVEDDGIGREKAKELSRDSTGMGLKIIERYIGLFNQFNRQKIHYEIRDLYHGDGNAAGTRVDVTM